MKSLSTELSDVDRIKSSTLTSPPSFFAYKNERWESINESAFYNALYTRLFVKDEEASASKQSVYVRKLF